MTPKKIKRGPVYFYISRWPADGVTNEVSVKMGYPFGEGAKATLTVGTAKFDLFTKEEGAFVEKTDTETSLIEAMKKGSTMKIDGKSARGTATSDVYSLDGLERRARPHRQGMFELISRRDVHPPVIDRGDEQD